MLQMTYQNVSIIKNQQHRYATSKVLKHQKLQQKDPKQLAKISNQ
jgi:hypothetical protein